MKFTKAQIEFLKTKFAFVEADFIAEAADFAPTKKRVYKEVPEEMRCTGIKVNGERCTKKKQEGKETCGVHSKTKEQRQAIAAKKTKKVVEKQVVDSESEPESLEDLGIKISA